MPRSRFPSPISSWAIAVVAAPAMAVAPRVVPAFTPAPMMVPMTEVSKAAVPRVATDQDKNPWAVSRKKTSSRGVFTQRVLNRPARYPPMAEARSEITVTPIILDTLKLVALIPWLDQGEMSVSPKPVPRNNRMSDRDAEATAPAKTAHQATAFPSDILTGKFSR